MTLVVGMHLGDAVGVVGDSRATLQYEDGRTVSLDNAHKVYAFPPYFVVGIAGDALSASGFVNSFYLRCFAASTQREAFERVIDLEWMKSHLLATYEAEIRDDLLSVSHPFRCVFACENTPALKESGDTPMEMSVPLTVSDASFNTSAAILTVPNAREGLRLVFSIAFPGGQIEVARPGNAILIGSGSIYETRLAQTSTLMAPVGAMSHGDRLAAAAWDVSRAAQLAGDPTINGIYFGLAMSCGVPQTMLHGFHEWPDDSEPKEHYVWEPYDFSDVPVMIPYSAGLDVSETNVGWIYDAAARKRMKLQSYLEPAFIDAQVKRQWRLLIC